MDDIFLSRDVGKWDSHGWAVVQAITDNEIADWLSALRQQHALIGLIVDACHSGTLLGGPNDRMRGVSPQAAETVRGFLLIFFSEQKTADTWQGRR